MKRQKKLAYHIARVLVLLCIFAGSTCGFSRYLNQGTGSTAESMEGAVLPLVYMLNEGTRYNCLHGYVRQMSVTATRDTLTPLSSDRTLDIQIKTFGAEIGDITFEVFPSGGGEALENTKVTQVTRDGEWTDARIQLSNRILINTEYVLQICVTADGEPVYYYTRILAEDNLHTETYLDFVMGFYEKCISRTDLDTLAAYIEPSSEAANTTLAHIDIHASMNQMIWADLSPQAYIKPTPSLKEINGTTATIRTDYMITAAGDDGTEYYKVSEYYRLRYSDDRILLLDFERDTSRMFDADGSVLSGGGINLGIQNAEDLEYKNDENARCFGFAVNGTLWLYDSSTGRMTEVFSFPEGFGEDERDTYGQNSIRIIDIDTDGNMYFLICGYMNRGAHEGEAGVAVYRFGADVSRVEECLFVETGQNYELLKKDADTLAYISSDRNRFYILVDGCVYGIRLDTRQVTCVAENVRDNCFVTSKSGRYFAWLQENEPYDSSDITVIDFDTLTTREITCGETERIRPLGFMGEDLVYGTANAADIDTAHAGSEVFPAKTLTIENGSGETVKSYAASGCYVTGVTVSASLLTLKRVTKTAEGYAEAADDQIVSNSTDAQNAYGLTTTTSTRKQTEQILRVGGTRTGKVSQIVRSKQVIYEGSKLATLEPRENTQTRYYVYGKGRLDSVYTTISQAVQAADALYGVVVDSSWQNIWERGNKETEKRLNLSEFPNVVNAGSLDVSAWTEQLSETVLDLAGCTLDEVLYYVSEGTPVAAKTPVTEEFPKGVVIIAGYDAYNTILLTPGASETFYYGLNDSTALFEEAGNVFLTYWDPISD